MNKGRGGDVYQGRLKHKCLPRGEEERDLYEANPSGLACWYGTLYYINCEKSGQTPA
jgi:hypothetical protein